MRERGPFTFLAILMFASALYYSVTPDETVESTATSQAGPETLVIINGRTVEPSYVDTGNDGRVVVLVEEEDLYPGENTVELQWGEKPPSTMRAELPAENAKH